CHSGIYSRNRVNASPNLVQTHIHHARDPLEPSRQLRGQAELAGKLDLIFALALIADEDETHHPFPTRLELGLDGAEAFFAACENRHAAAEFFDRSVDGLAIDQP